MEVLSYFSSFSPFVNIPRLQAPPRRRPTVLFVVSPGGFHKPVVSTLLLLEFFLQRLRCVKAHCERPPSITPFLRILMATLTTPMIFFLLATFSCHFFLLANDEHFLPSECFFLNQAHQENTFPRFSNSPPVRFPPSSVRYLESLIGKPGRPPFFPRPYICPRVTTLLSNISVTFFCAMIKNPPPFFEVPPAFLSYP